MSWKFEDQYLDVLHDIEWAINLVYREHPELADFAVDFAISGLVRVYQAELKARPAPDLALKGLEQQVYDEVKAMCDGRLGRLTGEAAVMFKGMEPKTLDEIVACLKRIRKSITLWTKARGRQGYLTYIADFLA